MARASNGSTEYDSASRDAGEAVRQESPADPPRGVSPPLTEVGQVSMIRNGRSAANIAHADSYHLPPGYYWLACLGVGAALWWQVASWLARAL